MVSYNYLTDYSYIDIHSILSSNDNNSSFHSNPDTPYEIKLLSYKINNNCLLPFIEWICVKENDFYVLPHFHHFFPNTDIDNSILDFKNICVSSVLKCFQSSSNTF